MHFYVKVSHKATVAGIYISMSPHFVEQALLLLFFFVWRFI